MIALRYPTDLKDNEWKAIEKAFLVSYEKGGRPVKHSKREILNAIFYIARTGCQWRYLPHDFPSWKTVYTYFRNWKRRGLFEKINYDLIKQNRLRMGRNANPSACIVDSQSVKTTEKVGSKDMMGLKKLRVAKGM